MKWKWTPTIGAILTAVIAVVSPEVQAWIAAHPAWAAALASVTAILTHFAPPPHK